MIACLNSRTRPTILSEEYSSWFCVRLEEVFLLGTSAAKNARRPAAVPAFLCFPKQIRSNDPLSDPGWESPRTGCVSWSYQPRSPCRYKLDIEALNEDFPLRSGGRALSPTFPIGAFSVFKSNNQLLRDRIARSRSCLTLTASTRLIRVTNLLLGSSPDPPSGSRQHSATLFFNRLRRFVRQAAPRPRHAENASVSQARARSTDCGQQFVLKKDKTE